MSFYSNVSYNKFNKKNDLNSVDLENPPVDAISSISFNSDNSLLAVASWDTTVRIYNVSSSYSKKSFIPFKLYNAEIPILSCCFLMNRLCVGLANGSILSYELGSDSKSSLTPHAGGVKALRPYNNFLISASFDCSIKIFNENLQEVHSIKTNGKIYCMDIKENFLAVGLSDKSVLLVDLNTQKQEVFKPKINYNIRSIALKVSNLGNFVIVGSVEGKAEIINIKNENKSMSIGYFNNLNNTVVLKCHVNMNKLYSVNFVDFYNDSVVVSAGSDGNIVFFNKNSRIKVCTGEFENPITAFCISPDNKAMVFGVGDDWSKGYMNENVKVELKYVDLSSVSGL